MTPRRLFEVPDVLEVHEVPSEEVMMVPVSTTDTKFIELIVEELIVESALFTLSLLFLKSPQS